MAVTLPDLPASRVVVTGIGLALPSGRATDVVWRRLDAAESAIATLDRFEAPAPQAAASVPDVELADRLRTPKNLKFMEAGTRCAVSAALDAVEASAIDLEAVGPTRLGLYVGSGETGLEGHEFFRAMEHAERAPGEPDYGLLGGRPSRLIDRHFSLRTLANIGVALISSELDARGPSLNVVHGDGASAQAMAAARDDLVARRCDVALAGGYDSLLNPSTFLAYRRQRLLSPSTAVRVAGPFDRDRDGLVLGEGAAFLVLEREHDARRRQARTLGVLHAVGMATDGDDAIGKSARSALERAIAAALTNTSGDSQAPVPGFIVAHGLGTVEADRREATLLSSLPADLLPAPVPVTAFKGHTGYLGAATGAVEIALAMMALRHRRIPPIARLAEADDDNRLDLVTRRARPLAARHRSALSLCWSWSGQCVATLIRDDDETSAADGHPAVGASA